MGVLQVEKNNLGGPVHLLEEKAVQGRAAGHQNQAQLDNSAIVGALQRKQRNLLEEAHRQISQHWHRYQMEKVKEVLRAQYLHQILKVDPIKDDTVCSRGLRRSSKGAWKNLCRIH